MSKNQLKLKDRVCIVTGGAGLIGTAHCRICAQNGAKVIMIEIDLEKAKKVAKDLIKETKNKNIYPIKCDISDEKAVVKAFESIVKKFGRIDVLVNNAHPRNKNYGRKFEDVTYADFSENLSKHLVGYFLMSREAAKIMARQEKGVIILMGSTYGIVAPKFEIYDGTPTTSSVEYAAMKGGVINMTKYMASYLGHHGIRVNSISPGGVFDNHKDPFLSNYLSKVRLVPRRMARPEDIANALLYLISDDSAYVTGHNLVVDGGWTI